MPKVKIPRKSTLIDMTAMCDVAFLLLTFFMLTTKFKTENPILVDLPKSVSDTLLQATNNVQVAVTKEGRVFFSVDGQVRREALANLLFTRKYIKLEYAATYNSKTREIELTSNIPDKLQEKVVREFSLEPNIDVSLANLPIWLQLTQEQRAALKDSIEKKNWTVNLRYPDNKVVKLQTGLDTTVTVLDGDKKSSDLILLTYWSRILDRKKANETAKASPLTANVPFNKLVDSLNSKIALRGDRNVPYPLIKNVISALQDADEYKYYFITNLRKLKK